MFDWRFRKRLVIGLVFILILGGLGWGVYALVRTRPNCHDRIQNGREEGIDCGVLACGISCPPVISPVQILEQHLIFVRNAPESAEYDFVAKVFNPNSGYGASQVDYDLTVTDESGAAGPPLGDTFYILPGQTRYVVFIGVKDSRKDLKAAMKIKSADWQRVSSETIPQLTVQSQNLAAGPSLEANIFNGSNYDFDSVDVSVVIFDSAGNVVGVNKTVIRTFNSQTSRYFKVAWPADAFAGPADKIDIEPVTNIINNANFIQNYGTQEKFQTYY